MKSKREIFVKVEENEQLRGVVPVYDAQETVKFDDEIGEKSRFETKTKQQEEEMSRAPEQDIGDILKKSWEVFMKDPVTHIIANLLFIVVSVVSLGILAAPLMVGYIRLIRDMMAGHEVSATDIFSGLSTTITSLITAIVIGIAVTIGLFFLVLPGIAIAFLLAFAFHFIAYKDSGVGDSLTESFNLAKENFVLVLIVIIIVGVLNAIGSSVFMVGSLLTVPFGMIVMNIAFERMTGLGGRS